MLEIQTETLSLTDAAASKLRELTAAETSPEIGLRVYVYSGGCSGFKYGKSIDLLRGSQIDYVDTLMGAGFTVNNPNAVAACGCGSSFRTADDGGAPRGCAH